MIPSDKSAVMSAGFDPIATDLPLVISGQSSARINNRQSGLPISSLSQTATLTTDVKPLLTFYWAAVLEDPQHAPEEQPYVDVSVFNDTKGIFLYQKRFYSNDPAHSGWKSYLSGQWKSIAWQRKALDLSAYIGDKITLKVEAASCSLGAHGGYAYLDVEE